MTTPPRLDTVPQHQIRALYDARTITVYQAYRPAIADAALAAQRFVPPFKLDRMTWVKPSFLWMMYRCGWASKAGQERVLAVRMHRDGFEWALAHASLSRFERGGDASREAWEQCKKAAPVRVQWDPERSLHLEPLPYRPIQIGLSGEAACRYATEWIAAIDEVARSAREIHALVAAGEVEAARSRLPQERPYPLPDDIAAAIGASRD